MFFINLDQESTDRYDFSKFMEYTNDSHDILNSYFIAKLKKLPSGGEKVIQAEEFRPDLLSYSIYGDYQYWWILMLYNDILDIEDVSIGLTVRYPTIDSLEDLFFSLKALERTERTTI